MDHGSTELTTSLINAFDANIAVLDEYGTIVLVNRAWDAFGASNDGKPSAIGPGTNYLRICEAARGRDHQQASRFASGLGDVLAGRRDEYAMEYPCHSPSERRWYLGKVRKLAGEGPFRAMIAHELVKPKTRVEESLRRQVRHASMVAEIRADLMPGPPLRPTLRDVALTLVSYLDAALVRIWTLDASGSVLELQASAGLYDHLDGPHGRVPVGSFKIGRIARERHPHLTNDVAHDPLVSDPAWVAREGLRSFAGYPLMVGDRLMGVLAVFAREPMPVDTFDAIGSVADSIAQGIAARAAERALLESEERFRLLIENAADAFFLHDESGLILDANQRAAESLGCPRADILGKNLEEIEVRSHDQGDQSWWKPIEPGASITFDGCHRRADGSAFPVETRTTAFDTERGRLFIALARDVTEQRKAADRLKHQAGHDALTGLPNRTLLRESMERAIDQAKGRGGSVALLLIDLDRFKEINDTFGHHYGDVVLQRLSPRLQAGLRPDDLVARLGGDEFAILLPDQGRIQAWETAGRIVEEGSRPIEVDGHRLDVGLSIGIAIYPEHAADAGELLQRADVAMYASKRSRSGPRVFEPEHRPRANPRTHSLAADLRRAIEDDRLTLHYQPKVDARTGRMFGVEALARWDHAGEGMIAPSIFIPMAEVAGLIRPLGLQVLDHALRDVALWRGAGLELSVAVNLAPDNLQDPRLFDAIMKILAAHDAPTDRLTVEVTESTMMADPRRVRSVLGRLHDAGVKISIDDFGTGYSSLTYLRDMPADEVKIDRTFVKDMAVDKQAACITRAVIDLGRSLGLKVVAEGVEDRATLDLLRSWGCDSIQGFYISHPLPAEQLQSWARNAPIGSRSAPDPLLVSPRSP